MLHKFIFDDAKIVVDVNSGAVHVVDDLVWELLDDYRRMSGAELLEKNRRFYPSEEVAEAIEEIRQLEQDNLLYSPDPFAQGYEPPPGGVIKSLCLHLAHACNLRCRYCFAGQGNFGGADELMPERVGRAAIDFLIEKSAGRKHLEIDFFGGEPLLNFGVLTELVHYGHKRGGERGKEFKFTLTTNAVLLNDDVTRFLNENQISVVLSLDGRREIHDAMRQARGGGGSYDVVLSHIKNFVNSRDGLNYYIRGTYTRHNLDFCADVLHLAGLGFNRISVEPVVAPPEADYAIRDEDIPFILSEYERLTRELLDLKQAGRPVDFFHFNIDLDGGPCLPKRLSGCGAGHEYLAVTPGGELYPCHQFAGRPEYLIGNVFQGIIKTEIMELFRNAHLYSKEGCAGCWAKFYCSGGCHANAEALNGSIFRPHKQGCVLARKRLECAIYLKTRESEISVES
ncbi:MAG: hypothetical protein A4E52_01878 [Pelotomaculum sp. PtaB.Bin013]|uniref:Thioether cross-link-forming SCIFF peptide maturase n=1 Tax=Pelotomaculum isophthalicicum JI TaxID=947010 RepID=A0A9X4H6L4_9FIRM|nr:thioether cross-link-forming SCIFF peptide maturase [Pelotomaculum isophthalicicum]MDF9407024.1 thioether cross-link-forming SCIFF peptide maturase [Pelotomaculum isophthalicicum JI]OPX83247.1 MAG: hypothetical protein A4E52_01878 [Pelotomaculum sp. PtaB.Bin013]